MPRLIEAEQRSPEWFEARLGKATASKFNDIMAKTRSGYSASRKNYAAELVTERLTGTKDESFTSAAMQWGIDNEPVARLQYSLASGNDVEETGFWLHDELEAGASPDGFIDDDGLLEIKCPNTATHIDTLIKRKLPYQYQAQVQGQMWVTGRKWCDFVSFDPRLPENAQMIIVRVKRDDIYIAELETEIKDFMEEVRDLVEFVKTYNKEG
jgi:putative phage-type endonuclease